jgi:glycosyltransferase involved in cell wall biosynthesis
MNERKTIIFVVNDPAFFLSHRVVLATAAQNQGFDVHVATANGEAVEKILSLGFVHHELPFKRSGTNPFYEAYLLYALYRLYRKVQPSLVHHVTIKPVLYGSIASRLAYVPAVVNAISGFGYVFSSTGFKPFLLRLPVKILYKIALSHKNNIVIVQNSHDYEVVIRFNWVAQNRVRIIRGAGVDLNTFKPIAEPPGEIVVVLASRMLWDKGVGIFVDAARTLHEKGIEARFVLVGSPDTGNPKSVTEDQIRNWVNQSIIEWWGYRDDMAIIFNQSHIVTLPTYYGEGVPKVLIEAAASGRPIVATEIPGCREVVQHDYNGILVPIKNSNALAEALQRLIENPALRLEMGANGRRLAEKDFAVESVVDQTMNIYRELLQ